MIAENQSFGRIELRPAQREVLVDGRRAPVGGRAFDVLLALVERRDRIVSKDELIESAWPNRVVEDNNLVVQVGALRKLLGASAIVNVPGRGYRFVAPASAPIEPIEPTAAAAESAPMGAPELRTNLPATLIPLIGRDADAANLAALLRAHKLITLTGPGGVGKSRLAQRLLHERRQAHAHGVAWVELASLSDPALVAGAIGRALGLQMGAGEPLAALVSALRTLDLLLALDNAEHLVDEVARVAQALLEGAPGLRLLVTSQVPLKLAQEQVVTLGPLEVPARLLPPAQALGFPAVELFVQRAQAVQRQFQLDERHVGDVIEICRRLDGLPLAIELAAARVPLLGVTALAASLGERLNLLRSGQRLAPARHQTLRAALEWSHALLGADEQCVLRRLGVFVGGFSMELAQQVAAEPGTSLDDWAVLDALGTLIERSLLVAEPGEPPRYRLLETMRVFALERLGAAHEEPEIRTRHARAVCARFEQVTDARFKGRLRGDDGEEMLAPDLDNAVAAVHWSVEHDAPTAVALMTPLSVARATFSSGDGVLWKLTEPLLTEALPLTLQAQWAFGFSSWWNIYDRDLAARRGHDAVDLFRRLNDPIGLYLALETTARAYMFSTEDMHRGELLLKEARSLENPLWPASVLFRGPRTQGMFQAIRGQPEEALKSLQAALSFAIKAGISTVRLQVQVYIAEVALMAGRLDEAISSGQDLVRSMRGSRRRFILATALVNLTAAWLAKNALAEARETAEEGWPLGPEFSLQDFWGDQLALLAALEGRPHSAARLLGYSEARYAAKGADRQLNEARAVDRAQQLVRAQLGDEEFARQRAEGASLHDKDVALVALPSMQAPAPVRGHDARPTVD